MAYDPEDYQLQKETGDRLPNGAAPLKRLTPRHRKLIELHLQGARNKDIAIQLGMTQSRVSILLGDPSIQQEIARGLKELEGELDALMGPAIDATRDALNAPQAGLRLRGVDRFVKLRETYGAASKGETAEDVAARLLARISDSNVQINVNGNGQNSGELVIPTRRKTEGSE